MMVVLVEIRLISHIASFHHGIQHARGADRGLITRRGRRVTKDVVGAEIAKGSIFQVRERYLTLAQVNEYVLEGSLQFSIRNSSSISNLLHALVSYYISLREIFIPAIWSIIRPKLRYAGCGNLRLLSLHGMPVRIVVNECLNWCFSAILRSLDWSVDGRCVCQLYGAKCLMVRKER